MAFPDPSVPIATCHESECSQCPVASSIHCHFRPADLAHFLPGGFAVVWGYPVPFFVLAGLWSLLGLYVLLTTGFFVSLKMFLCTQCMNFACPLNRVPASTRALFFLRNPSVAKAWER